jgi:hypothetical protein
MPDATPLRGLGVGVQRQRSQLHVVIGKKHQAIPDGLQCRIQRRAFIARGDVHVSRVELGPSRLNYLFGSRARSVLDDNGFLVIRRQLALAQRIQRAL